MIRLPSVIVIVLGVMMTGCLFAPEPPGPKRIFVTSSLHSGDLGGRAGADSICGLRATEGGHDGEWIAFLSDSLTRARGLARKADSWRLVDGRTTVFKGRGEFTRRARATITTELGHAPSGGHAWTGTLGDGQTHAGHHCMNWTSASQEHFGSVGEPVRVEEDTGPRWLHIPGTPRCGTEARIYCMER